MNLSKTIKINRKKQNLTQEDLANYLNISVPAISKWENGLTYPDITLLMPLSKILKIDMNTLLSFNSNLSISEINDYIRNLSFINKDLGFEKAFEEGFSLIKSYSNSDRLIFEVLNKLNIFLIASANHIKEKDIYEEKLINWFSLIIDSNDSYVSNHSKFSLLYIYKKKNDFAKAKKILNSFPENTINKRFQEGLLFKMANENNKALKSFENIILQNAFLSIASLTEIVKLLLSNKNFKEALLYIDFAKKLVLAYNLNICESYLFDLYLVSAKKDTEESLKIIKIMLNSEDYTLANMYKYLDFPKSTVNQKEFLKLRFKNDKDLNFLKNDPRFLKMIYSKNRIRTMEIEN